MALVIEDGSIVPNASSFVTLVEASTYFALYNNPVQWSSATEGAKEAALRTAVKYLKQKFKYKGSLESLEQPLPFPRSEFYDSEGRVLCGSGVIPQDVKDAQCELALRHLISDLFLNTNPGSVRLKSKTVGDSSETYETSKSITNFAYVNGILGEYILSYSSSTAPIIKGG